MKQSILKLAVQILFIGLAHFTGYGQQSVQLNAFTAVENDGEVLLNWELMSGSICSGIAIQRSDNNLSFENIGGIDGVCGNLSSPVTYNYTDAFPIPNKINYYRLEFGDGHYSKVLSLDVRALNADGYLIRTENSRLRILFRNKDHSKYQLYIYNLAGQQVCSSSTSDDYFQPDISGGMNQLLFFKIVSLEKSEKAISGKFMIAD